MAYDLQNVELVHARKMERHSFKADWSGYDHYSFLVALEGTLYYQMDDGERYVLEPPFMFWNHPDHTYRYGHIETNGKWTHAYAAFSGSRARRLMEEGFMSLGLPSFFRLSDASFFESCFDRIVGLFNENAEFMAQDSILSVEGMFLELQRISAARRSEVGGHEKRLLELAKALRENPLEDVDFHNWARANGMSYSNFRLLFKKALGESPRRYLLRRRHLWARKQIIETDLPLQQIGYEIGYDNPSVFSRAFAKFNGASASELRRSF